MRFSRFGAICLTILPVIGLAGAPLAAATELLTNGDFETGNFNGWTLNTESGSDGAFSIVHNGPGSSPTNGLAYLNNPTGGTYFAKTAEGGPGAYSLSQSFTTDGSANITLSFQYFAESNGTSASVNSTNPK